MSVSLSSKTNGAVRDVSPAAAIVLLSIMTVVEAELSRILTITSTVPL